VRLFFDEATGKRVGILCRVLAAARKVYRQVEPSELEKIGGTVHHGGIVAVVAQEPLREALPGDPAAWFRRGESVVVLDRIGNPHNLGAIARTAAYFGVPRLLLSGDPASAIPGDAAYRVAEGGMEFMDICTVRDIPAALRALAAAGFDVVGAATRGGSGTAPPKVGKPTPWALVLGNEERGLEPETTAACSRLATIGGSGHVESLNVSVAAAVLMHSLVLRWRPQAKASSH